MYYRATILKALWNWHRNTQKDEWIQPETDPRIYELVGDDGVWTAGY